MLTLLLVSRRGSLINSFPLKHANNVSRCMGGIAASCISDAGTFSIRGCGRYIEDDAD